MAEIVGGALLSGFIDVLFERMMSKEVKKFFLGKNAVPKLLNELKIRLISVDALLNDAEEKQLKNQKVKEWLEELKDAMYDADHVVDKINAEALRCEIEDDDNDNGGGQSNKSTKSKLLNCIIPARFVSRFDRTVEGELEEILGTLKLLVEQSDHLGLKRRDRRSRSLVRSLAPLVEECDVFGREAERNSLVEFLLSDDATRPKISVIPIVGMGGIGKTTLAQIVYNNSRVQRHFDLKVWVTVSEDFDVPKLTKTIFESITSTTCDIENPHEVQSKLKAALRGKKFLFVHDDIWNEKYELWDLLKSPFESGAHGSKIIVTTRSDIVASQMGNVEPYHLRCISKDDCWELFAKHVFENVESDSYSDMKKIGIQIVEKCKGLPLAVKSIAGLLRSTMNLEAWRRVLESDIWELEIQPINGTNILPALWLSYSFLPPGLKRCFAFLSNFPKDYEFHEDDRERIVLLWMAEGILNLENARLPEDVGKEYMSNLISRSFFQRSMEDQSVLVMHDLMHDLALFVSGGLIRQNPSKTRHFSYGEHSENLKLDHLSDAKRLRIILSLSPLFPYTPVLRAVLDGKIGECLRVLSLSNGFIAVLPDSIGRLKHLRYLDLSKTGISELPSSICVLYNLQSLLLSNCKDLTKLPDDIFRLINLRHLDISDTPIREMPPRMLSMKNLRTLSYYILGDQTSGTRIKELGELRFLCGRFRITKLQNAVNVEDVLGANLKDKRHISDLILEWDGTTRNPQKESEVLNALEPHPELKKIEIWGYEGAKFPSWVARESFHGVVEVTLKDCHNCRSLPPFGQLPTLKELKLWGMNGVVSIGDEFCGTCSLPFPSLEKLTIYQMSSWKTWSFCSTEQGGLPLFPRLKQLEVTLCKSLTIGLPVARLPALEYLLISVCDSVVSIFPTSQVVQIDTAYPSLENMEVKYCSTLESFSRTRLLPSSLKAVSLWGCPMLIWDRRNWGLQSLASLRTLNLHGSNPPLELGYSFPEEGLLPSGLECLSLDFFTNMKGLNGNGLQHLASLQQLSICDCNQLERMPEEGLPASVTSLSIVRCPLLVERCKRGAGLDWPKIRHIPEIVVDRKQI